MFADRLSDSFYFVFLTFSHVYCVFIVYVPRVRFIIIVKGEGQRDRSHQRLSFLGWLPFGWKDGIHYSATSHNQSVEA